jgi:hypothetical protein
MQRPDNILPLPIAPDPSTPGPVPAEAIDEETCELKVYKRNVLAIVPGLTHCAPDDVKAWEERGYCWCEFKQGIEVVTFKGISWWNVLRQIQSDSIRRGKLANPNT